MVDEMEDIIEGHCGEKTRRRESVSIHQRRRSNGGVHDQWRCGQWCGRQRRRESLNCVHEGLDG